jgi:D-hydroxyproline dehydrogenase subunit gamma
MTARFVRLAETGRSPITIEIDGDPVQALQGDTLLVAILCKRGRVRVSEFGDGSRAGFCLMGACQDCWVWTAEGARLRACSTLVSDGMKIVTQEPQNPWSHA